MFAIEHPARCRDTERIKSVKKFILFDHDGVLVDTELWYYKAGERALADIGFSLDKDRYLTEMNWGRAPGRKRGRQASTS